MSAPQFTPGPWREREYSTDIVVSAGLREAALVRRIFTIAGECPTAARIEQVANARLIAAAPDLYAACYALIHSDDLQAAIDLARAALAKARGEVQS